jgi:UDP-glucuronate 4-epimerase
LGIPVVSLDICDKAGIEKLIVEEGITHIAHLAAQAGVRYSIQHPQVYVQANVHGFVELLEVCKLHPHIKIVYASSSSVYGNNQKIPFSETDATDSPASLYAATKKADELIAHAYHRMYGLSLTGLRFFTVFGPWGRPDMAYYSFTESILNHKPIFVFNNGNMQRDFTYIADIVEGTAAAIDLEAHYEIFNLGNHKPEQLLDLIEIIEELTGKKAQKNFLPMQLGDIPISFADISKSQKLLGYQPKVSLRQGMEHFYSWYTEWKASLKCSIKSEATIL